MRVASVVVLVALAAACGGAAESAVLGEAPDGSATTTSSGSAGNTASSSGVTGTSGVISSSASSGVTTSSSGVVPLDGGVPDTGGPVTGKCNVNAKDCSDTEYCKTDNCAPVGTCVPRPTVQTLDLSPVCGCDHVTYWNESVAGIHGMSFSSKTGCGNSGTSCTKNTGCAGDAKCNLEQPAICAVTEVKGTCWQLPKSCEGTNSRQVRRCTNAQCTTLCAAIDDERQFTPGTACP